MDIECFEILKEREMASTKNRRPCNNLTASKWKREGFTDISMKGCLVRINPLNFQDDAENLFLAGNSGSDPDRIWNFLGYGPFQERAEMDSWLEKCEVSTDPLFYVFRNRATNEAIGMGTFMEIRKMIGVAEIGNIWIGSKWHKSAMVTEALSLMMHKVLDDYQYRRLEWKCNALNCPSRNAALRLGFRYEGIFLNHMIVKGRNRDTAWYSITDNEWPEVRKAHEHWLSPTNFDEEGKQKKKLSHLTKALWI